MHERTLVVWKLPTKTFNSVGSTYWYNNVTWPTGAGNATIAAGTYTANLYFNSLPTGAGSVNITVRVHHTKADGTDAQLITSASTTITSGTADPLALNLGSGALQTFTSADPRRLRLQIEVTAVANGGSFVLDYDGTCATSRCSNLDTPVVTVPEPGLGLIGLAVTLPALAAELRRRRLRRLRQEKRREGGGA